MKENVGLLTLGFKKAKSVIVNDMNTRKELKGKHESLGEKFVVLSNPDESER